MICKKYSKLLGTIAQICNYIRLQNKAVFVAFIYSKMSFLVKIKFITED